ncbi:MAG: DUF2961 domain-containing protein [Tannerellaceae bacterium]|nr:DUF2961 domain-containing protein [Tannerellaceae bacterium]
MNLHHTIYTYSGVFALWLISGFFSCSGNKDVIGLATLFDEMTSVEEAVRYPLVPYRTFTLSGRAESVLFDQQGPGVITRIRLTSEDKRGIVRIYLDDSPAEELTLSAYDLSQLNIPEAEGGLLTAGKTLYLPVPYHKHCRITLEEPPGTAPKYYQIQYRRYPQGTPVESFSLQRLLRMKRRIAEVNRQLLGIDSVRTGQVIQGQVLLEAGNPFMIKLPRGEHAVYSLQLQVAVPTTGTANYAQCMRDIVLQGVFDGKLTLRVPVSDFSGGGMGAPYVKSYYLSADGRGGIVSRWLMPYREKASLSLVNEGRERLNIRYEVHVAPLPWDNERSLYFHASWKEELGLRLETSGENDWDFATIRGGRGIYKGDVLTVYNHTASWYGEGGMNIYVDGDDDVPSHTEQTAGDYYNHPGQPLTTFQTPFGGAPRADTETATGYSALFRSRIMDGIPFGSQLSLKMGLLGRKAGTIDCATTIFWYGDKKARPEKISRPEVWARTLLPSPVTEIK